MAREGCAPLRRGLLDHFPALGPLGVALYAWLILTMNPETRRVETTAMEMRTALATGPTQVARTLKYLESKGYITYTRGNGRFKSVITVLKPDCPTTGAACPLAGAEAPCTVLMDTVRVTAAAVRAERAPTEDLAVRRVYKVWNDVGVMRHRKLTETMAKKVQRVLATTSEARITDAIRNYGAVVLSKEHWFDYRYTLDEFLTRKGGVNIVRFGSDAKPLDNFKTKKGSSVQDTSAAEKYADL